MPAIVADQLFKVFGRSPTRGVDALRQGATRADLRKDGLTAAVIDASFSVEPGEIFVIMGLSGSGKSTVIRMVNGLIEATAGRVEIDGEPVSDLSPAALRQIRRQKISMVFQHFALLPHRTVGENAAYGLTVQGINRADREKAAEEALSMVGLGGWGSSMPDELSGGMQQRVGLARALASGTDIMLMDEAFSALDPLIRRDMQDQLVELQQKLDKTILFITHDLNEAMRLGDRIAMMRDGRIEQVGTAEEILNTPVNNYVAQFIQDVDRSRVMTASTVMESPAAVLGSEQGPIVAQKLMRETQSRWLLVLNRDRTPAGILWEEDVARAVAARETSLPWPQTHQMPVVPHDRPLAELFADSARHRAPLVVTDPEGRVVGVIPQVTLLAAAAPHEAPHEAPESPPDEAPDPTQPGPPNLTKEPTPTQEEVR